MICAAVQVELQLQPSTVEPGFTFVFEAGPCVDENGINFAGKLTVEHAADSTVATVLVPGQYHLRNIILIYVDQNSGLTEIYLPFLIPILTLMCNGRYTYDPAGRTGDPHASERVGNS
jgi:hypothetical protein|eukprot:COSAG01_NODE_3198_length_6430_cov_10.203759_6_plen_118_part_00